MKENLRKKLLKNRKRLSYVDVTIRSKKIEKRFFETKEYQESQIIFFYISYNNEVYTHYMIKRSISEEKILVVPLCNKEERTLIISRLDKWNDLKMGAYNILEPKRVSVKEISIDRIDLIIVPGLGFDKLGHRIGHGMGYFDRLLKNSHYAKHMGLAFEMQIVDKIYSEKHDIPVDIIVTEKRVINCRDFR
jgi:5-formyltetrahydrofolate cyclo-ligase